MILLIGPGGDDCLRVVGNCLEKTKAAYVFVDQGQHGSLELHMSVTEGTFRGTLRLAGCQVPLETVTAVYSRLADPHDLPEFRDGDSTSAEFKRCAELHARLNNWLQSGDHLLINPDFAQISNSSKPYQLQLIGQSGFLIPRTLVTNDSDEVLAFLSTCPDGVIYKSSSGVRSITQRFAHKDLERLGSLRICPVQFQEYVVGLNVRVHVCDKETFATAICSSAPDYRYAIKEGYEQPQYSTFDLAPDIARRCCLLTSALGLRVSGIDLCLSGDLAYCFEVNPSPAFAFFQEQTGQPIANAIATILCRRDGHLATKR